VLKECTFSCFAKECAISYRTVRGRLRIQRRKAFRRRGVRHCQFSRVSPSFPTSALFQVDERRKTTKQNGPFREWAVPRSGRSAIDL